MRTPRRGLSTQGTARRALTAAAAMPAVCAAMPVPFLAFRNPSVPQEARARGTLEEETTWICVLGAGRHIHVTVVQGNESTSGILKALEGRVREKWA